MPKFSSAATRKYRRHKASGQAVVTIAGREHGTKASKLEYDRLIGEWLANGRQALNSTYDLTIDEVLARYWEFASGVLTTMARTRGTAIFFFN